MDRTTLISLSSTLLSVALATLAGGACDTEDCTTGTEGCGCREDQCVTGLSCRSGICVDPNAPPEDEDGDDDDGDDDDGESSCADDGAFEIGGGLETEVSAVVFDQVEVEMHHKRDVDPFEDGCINDVTIHLVAGRGCELTVRARDQLTPQSRLAVESVEFSADSQCPNFPDAAEGNYVAGDIIADGSGIDGELVIPEENAGRACFEASYSLFLAGTLTRGTDVLTVFPSEITLRGNFLSTSSNRSCPVFPSE